MSDSPQSTAYLKEHLGRILNEDGDPADLSGLREDENLLANGMVDSLGILKLVAFIENKFEVQVPDEDVTVQNFRSLKDIGDYLERRKGGPEVSG